jgi:hypothetical protein
MGPWLRGFWFDVPGKWRSKSNYRRGPGQGRDGSGSWGVQRTFEAQVSALARLWVPDDWELGSREAKVSGRPGVVVFVYVDSLLDVPNLSKSAVDALEGAVYFNDASVRHCASMGLRGREAQSGVIGVVQLGAGVDKAGLLDASDQLARVTLREWENAKSAS